eukprot:7534907-Prorocentrum_lima.AAC.1
MSHACASPEGDQEKGGSRDRGRYPTPQALHARIWVSHKGPWPYTPDSTRMIEATMAKPMCPKAAKTIG